MSGDIKTPIDGHWLQRGTDAQTDMQTERETDRERDRQRDKVTARLAHGPLVTPTGCGNIQMVNRAKHFTAITISFSLPSTLSLSDVGVNLFITFDEHKY